MTAGDLVIRPWTHDDAPAIAALTERYFTPDPAWTPEITITQLSADALGGGSHALVAERGGRVAGVVAYVRAARGCTSWPLLAMEEFTAGG